MSKKSLSTEEKLKVASHSTQALMSHLFEHSVSVINTHDSASSPERWELFSGTLVEIGDRLFVATASHCLANSQSHRGYWILGNKAKRKAEDSCVTAVHRSSCDDDPDVGILELDKDLFSSFSSQTGVPISRLKPSGIGRCDRLAILLGCPGERVMKEQVGLQMNLGIHTDSYVSNPLEKIEWPTSKWPKLDPEKDILLSYPGDAALTCCLETGKPQKLPEPHGMSGGGLWDQGFGAGLWSPENSFLFGIQSSWFPTEMLVKATQIQHWLKLLYANYPDLRHALQSEVPDLFADV